MAPVMTDVPATRRLLQMAGKHGSSSQRKRPSSSRRMDYNQTTLRTCGIGLLLEDGTSNWTPVLDLDEEESLANYKTVKWST